MTVQEMRTFEVPDRVKSMIDEYEECCELQEIDDVTKKIFCGISRKRIERELAMIMGGKI